eukprot:4668494-Pleurochrysis_carterae.AAC.1
MLVHRLAHKRFELAPPPCAACSAADLPGKAAADSADSADSVEELEALLARLRLRRAHYSVMSSLLRPGVRAHARARTSLRLHDGSCMCMLQLPWNVRARVPPSSTEIGPQAALSLRRLSTAWRHSCGGGRAVN